MKKKALILASVASMIEQFNRINIELLQEMEYEVHVACNFMKGNTCSDLTIKNFINELEKMNVRYYQIDFSRKIWNLCENETAYRQVKKLFNSNEYDILHCHSPIGGLVGRMAAKDLPMKVIYTAHGFHFYKGAPFFNWILFYPIEKWLSRYTDILVTINKEDYQRAEKCFYAKEVKYVPGVGVDIENIESIKVDREIKRHAIRIPKEAFLILSVGELNENKNHEIVIRAIKHINNKSLYYIICGKGEKEKKLKALVQNLGLTENVKFLGYRQDILELYKASDLVIHPSKREGLSVALMEAMACHQICIASAIRGNEDLIIDQENGFLFPLNNIDILVNKINYVIENREKIKQMGNEASDAIRERGKDSIRVQMQKIYST